MKKYYLYVDESGKFELKENNPSIVGGFITETAPDDLFKEMEATLTSFQKVNLGFEDIHASEILHPNHCKSMKEEKNIKRKEKYIGIKKETREYFIERFWEILEKNAIYFIKVENKPFLFGNENEQSRYGSCLMEYFKQAVKIINNLGYKDNKETEVIFNLARRNTKFVPDQYKNFRDYYNRLNQYIENRKSNINIKGINRYVKDNVKISNLLKLADVTCYYLRYKQNKIDKSKLTVAVVNDLSIQNYNNFITNIEEKISKNLYAIYKSANNLSLKQEILERLNSLDKEEKLEQCEDFLNIVKDKIDNTREFDEAKNIANKINQAIESIHIGSTNIKNKNRINKINQNLSNYLMIIDNHKGSISTKHKNKSISLIEKQKDIPYYTKQEDKLATINRSYNQEFNRYDFKTIVNSILFDIDKREKAIENNKDHLIGKMYGTIGQAYAFLSSIANNIQSLRNDKAEGYLNKSISHFDKGHEDYNKSVNYLLNLYWYHNELDNIIKVICEKIHVEMIDKNEKVIFMYLIENMIKDSYNIFDFSLFLKLIISYDYSLVKSNNNIDLIIKSVDKINYLEHPLELIYKWIAIFYIYCKDYNKAIEYFNKSYSVIKEDKEDYFTIKTIILPCIALESICYKRLGRNDEAKKCIEEFEINLSNRMQESKYFAEYIDNIGGKEKLLQDVKVKNVKVISKWMPFTYS